jgi:hypothetical protein
MPVVLESSMTVLAGWAAATGAVDLSGVNPEPLVLDPEVRKALDSALFFGGTTTGREVTSVITPVGRSRTWCAVD